MSRYEEVNWKLAACDGMPFNLFYVFEEHKGAINTFFNISIVKDVCATCPIQRDCLTYSIQNEDFGIWGGLNTKERKALVKGEPQTLFTKAINELLKAGISIGEIQEVLDEYSRNERSLANETSD